MNVLITGAGKGLGAALAACFASNAPIRIFLTSRNKNSLNALKNNLKTKFPMAEVVIIACDLTSSDDLDALADCLHSSVTTLDIVINNAGMLVNKPFDQFDISLAEEVFRVNYFAPAALIKKVSSLLEAADKPHVVNIASMGGVQGSVKFPGLSHYSASKAALSVLTECLAAEYKEKGIAFNCLAPGSFRSEMLETAFPGYSAPVEPEDMARFVCDFAMKAHHVMNGKIIPVALSTP